MRIIETEVYKFDELSDEGKEKAISNLYNLNVDYYEWWESTYEDAENIGLKITEFDLDRNRYAKGDFIANAFDTAMLIISNHGENTETYQTAINYLEKRDCWFCSYDDLYENLDTEDIDNEFLQSLCEDYSIMLQKEYEYLCSKEAIEETIRVNEYEFTGNGELY